MKLILKRTHSNDRQTEGELILVDENLFMYGSNGIIFDCHTLEPPDKDNQLFTSRVLADTYWCEKRYSKKYGWHIKLEDKHGRTWILIHAGNFYKDTTGCILVGNSYSDIDGDGYRDVLNSKATLNRLLELLPDRFELEIIDED